MFILWGYLAFAVGHTAKVKSSGFYYHLNDIRYIEMKPMISPWMKWCSSKCFHFDSFILNGTVSLSDTDVKANPGCI